MVDNIGSRLNPSDYTVNFELEPGLYKLEHGDTDNALVLKSESTGEDLATFYNLNNLELSFTRPGNSKITFNDGKNKSLKSVTATGTDQDGDHIELINKVQNNSNILMFVEDKGGDNNNLKVENQSGDAFANTGNGANDKVSAVAAWIYSAYASDSGGKNNEVIATTQAGKAEAKLHNAMDSLARAETSNTGQLSASVTGTNSFNNDLSAAINDGPRRNEKRGVNGEAEVKINGF